jgi:hypothetical protein
MHSRHVASQAMAFAAAVARPRLYPSLRSPLSSAGSVAITRHASVVYPHRPPLATQVRTSPCPSQGAGDTRRALHVTPTDHEPTHPAPVPEHYRLLSGLNTGDEPGIDVRSEHDQRLYSDLTEPSSVTVGATIWPP